MEGEYQGSDFIAGAKVGLNLDLLAFSYTQSITKDFILGFELLNMLKPRKVCDFNYAMKYNTNRATYFA